MEQQVLDYDIWAREHRSDPQALYARMRAESPIHRQLGPVSGNPFWFLTRYDDCVAFLKDQRFGKQIDKHLSPEAVRRWWGDGDPTFDPVNHHMLNLDPPDHTRLRALIHKAFTPRMIENLRPRISAIADELIDHIEGQSEIDLLADFGFPLPITVIAELLGVPVSDQDKFREWTKALVFGGSPESSRVAALEFAMYTNNLIDERAQSPRDDLITALVQAEEAGDKLDRAELMSMIFLLLVAGHETTVNLIGNGTLALMQHPDQLDKLRAQPGLIRTAVEEMLRYNGPVETTTLRMALTDDAEIGGVHIPQGEGVLAALVAANRDPAVFPNPDTFDITREPNKHIAFGNGIHYCVGAPLARLEGTIAISRLVSRLPHLELAVEVDALKWNDNLLLHGMAALPVRL
jgi:cytochrome P450 PksS